MKKTGFTQVSGVFPRSDCNPIKNKEKHQRKPKLPLATVPRFIHAQVGFEDDSTEEF